VEGEWEGDVDEEEKRDGVPVLLMSDSESKAVVRFVFCFFSFFSLGFAYLRLVGFRCRLCTSSHRHLV